MLPVLVLTVLQTQADATTSAAAQNAVQAPAPAAVFPYSDAEVMLDAFSARRSLMDQDVPSCS